MGLRAVQLRADIPLCTPRARGAPILALEGVSLFHRKRTVLQNLSLQAARGDVIAVIGRSGAGKTTFARALCGLHRKTAGKYRWMGDPQKPAQRMKRACMVMQDVNYQLFAESVEAECGFGIRHPDAALIDRTLADLALSPLRKHHPNTLYGGQKQRLAVAVSMVCGKDLLVVFDEPTSGLDFDSMERLSAFIRALSESGRIIFVVTHDYEFVLRTCTRVLYLNDGAVQQDTSVSSETIPIIEEVLL